MSQDSDPDRQMHTLDAVGRGTVFMAFPTIYYRFLQEPSFREKARSWQVVAWYDAVESVLVA